MKLKFFKNKNYYISIALFLSVCLQNFYIPVGFAFKPFMFMEIILILIMIIKRKRIHIRNFSYEKTFLVFMGYIVTRGIFSYYRVNYMRMVFGLLIVIVFYLLCSDIIKRISIEEIFKAIYISGNVFLCLSLILYYFNLLEGGTLDRGLFRLSGTTTDPNIFVIFATPIFAISIYKMFKGEKKYYISYILSQLCIMLSYSRGGFIGIIVLVILMITQLDIFRPKIMVTLVLISIASFYLINGVNYSNNINEINTKNIVETRMRDKTGSGRLLIWRRGLETFRQEPVFGIGLNNFIAYNEDIYEDHHYMHNTLLEVLVEQGIIGGILFLLFLLQFVYHKSCNEEAKLFKLIIISLLFQSLFLSVILNAGIYIMFSTYKAINLKSIE